MTGKALRCKEARGKFGLSNSRWYERIKEGQIPPGTKIFPDGRTVVWFENELDEIIERAIARRDAQDAAERHERPAAQHHAQIAERLRG